MSEASRAMRFEVDGQGYFLDFKYTHSKKETYDGEVVESTNPNTTVFIMKEGGPASTSDDVYLSHTVGCLATDNFARRVGRIAALRCVGKTLSKEFRKAMWEAYAKRVPPKVKKVSNVVPFPQKG